MSHEGGEKIQGKSLDISINIFSLIMLLMASLKLGKVQTWANHAIFLDMLFPLRENQKTKSCTFTWM